jgi:peptidoglycan hydrolase CwlO-like protein
MWKELTAFLQTVFTLARDQQQAREEIKELRQDLTKLTLAVAHLVGKIELIHQEDGSEREKLAMRLQMELMKFEKQLSEATTTKSRAKLKSRATADKGCGDGRK